MVAQRAVKAAVAAARTDALERDVSRVLALRAARDSKGMWAQLRRLAGRQHARSHGPAALRAAAGEGLVTGEQQIADALAAQYAAVSDPATFAAGAGFDEDLRQRVEADVAQFRAAASLTDIGPPELSTPITAVEVALQAQGLGNNKAPSPLDDITNEHLRFGGPHLHHALASFYNLQFSLEAKAQTDGVITPIFKRGDPTEPANYRPITLGSAIDKLYNLVLNARLCDHLERGGLLHDAQQGFRAGRCAVDNIFMLTSCLDARARQGLDTYVLFLDIQKAYDTVWRAGLLWHLWRKGVRGKLFRVLAQMTDNTRGVVMHRGVLSTAFEPGMGWEQGDTLATTMFNVFVDAVLEEVWAAHPGVPLPAAGLAAPDAAAPAAAKLVALMYADDGAALAATPPSLQALIDATRAALNRWRLKASVDETDASKTAVMVVPAERRRGRRAGRAAAAAAAAALPEWRWGGVRVPRVSEYKYLGAWLAADRSWAGHLRCRQGAAEGAFGAHAGVLRQRRLPLHLRMLTLTSVVQPVLTHAAQVWARPTVAMRGRLDAWQAAHVARMTGCPPTASHACLQQELGVMPLHVVCDCMALRFWHRLGTLPPGRLLRRVADAWRDTPWWASMARLRRDYGVEDDSVRQLPGAQFAALVAKRAALRVAAQWGAAGAQRLARHGVVAARYVAAFGRGLLEGGKPAPREYMRWLAGRGRGLPAELLMRLRVECLPLRAMHSHARPGESQQQRVQRERCPCCPVPAAETVAHFLFECPALGRPARLAALLAAVRDAPAAQGRHLHGVLVRRLCRAGIGAAAAGGVAAVAAGPASADAALELELARRWLLGPCLRSEPVALAVADYVVDVWRWRNAALDGRGADGGDPAV